LKDLIDTMLSENPERDIVINFKNNAYLLTIKQTEINEKQKT
jgi:hypothetical protein